jgi:hypothetical protein
MELWTLHPIPPTPCRACGKPATHELRRPWGTLWGVYCEFCGKMELGEMNRELKKGASNP